MFSLSGLLSCSAHVAEVHVYVACTPAGGWERLRTSVPWSSWILKSRGGSGMEVDSQEAPHTLFMPSQPVLGPLICTSLMDPRTAASCSTTQSGLSHWVNVGHIKLMRGTHVELGGTNRRSCLKTETSRSLQRPRILVCCVFPQYVVRKDSTAYWYLWPLLLFPKFNANCTEQIKHAQPR